MSTVVSVLLAVSTTVGAQEVRSVGSGSAREGRVEVRCDARCYFNVRSKADISQLNLPHGTDN